MVKSNQISKNENAEQKEIKNCPRLDGEYCLDKEVRLVKRQYGAIDGKKSMDQGVMLK